MRFPEFNWVLRCQEEPGNVTSGGLVTDIFTEIVNYRLRLPLATSIMSRACSGVLL